MPIIDASLDCRYSREKGCRNDTHTSERCILNVQAFRATDVSVRVVVSSPDNGPTGWDIHLGLKGSTLSHLVPSPATSDVAQVIIYSSHYYRSSFFVTYISHTSLFTISNTHPLYMHAPHAKTYTHQASI